MLQISFYRKLRSPLISPYSKNSCEQIATHCSRFLVIHAYILKDV